MRIGRRQGGQEFDEGLLDAYGRWLLTEKHEVAETRLLIRRQNSRLICDTSDRILLSNSTVEMFADIVDDAKVFLESSGTKCLAFPCRHAVV